VTAAPTRIMVLEGKNLLNEDEAARFLGISVRTLRRWTPLHNIETRKMGGARRWTVEGLVRFRDSAR
jgi:hypothetical protein